MSKLIDYKCTCIFLAVCCIICCISCKVEVTCWTLLVCFVTSGFASCCLVSSYCAEGVTLCSNCFCVCCTATFSCTSECLCAACDTCWIGIDYAVIPCVIGCCAVVVTTVYALEGVSCILAVTVRLDCTCVGVFKLFNFSCCGVFACLVFISCCVWTLLIHYTCFKTGCCLFFCCIIKLMSSCRNFCYICCWCATWTMLWLWANLCTCCFTINCKCCCIVVTEGTECFGISVSAIVTLPTLLTVVYAIGSNVCTGNLCKIVFDSLFATALTCYLMVLCTYIGISYAFIVASFFVIHTCWGTVGFTLITLVLVIVFTLKLLDCTVEVVIAFFISSTGRVCCTGAPVSCAAIVLWPLTVNVYAGSGLCLCLYAVTNSTCICSYTVCNTSGSLCNLAVIPAMVTCSCCCLVFTLDYSCTNWAVSNESIWTVFAAGCIYFVFLAGCLCMSKLVCECCTADCTYLSICTGCCRTGGVTLCGINNICNFSCSVCIAEHLTAIIAVPVFDITVYSTACGVGGYIYKSMSHLFNCCSFVVSTNSTSSCLCTSWGTWGIYCCSPFAPIVSFSWENFAIGCITCYGCCNCGRPCICIMVCCIRTLCRIVGHSDCCTVLICLSVWWTICIVEGYCVGGCLPGWIKHYIACADSFIWYRITVSINPTCKNIVFSCRSRKCS